MIGLVIATHSRLAEELLKSAEMIIGPVSDARSVCVGREDGADEIRDSFLSALDEVGSGGAIVMADMLGGTPANIGATFLGQRQVEVLTGVNLPMVLKFFGSRGSLPLPELASMLKAYGQQSICLTSDFMKK